MEKVKILFVDDEPHNRTVFYANFRKKYQIYLGESGEEGIQILKENPDIDIIITDQKMPQMSGIEFLEKLEENIAPFRIVVTAHRDMTILELALREGKINDYYDKPWNVEVLERLIDNAIKSVFKKR